jgi:hypothetical protein
MWNPRSRRPGLVARLFPMIRPLDTDSLIVGLVVVLYYVYVPLGLWLWFDNMLSQFLALAL